MVIEYSEGLKNSIFEKFMKRRCFLHRQLFV